MNTRLAVFIALLSLSLGTTVAQVNMTDASGKKQGPWVKKYENGTILYQGTFRNDKPVGEFKRFYEDGTVKAVMNYDDAGETATAVFYHSDGKKAAEGKYVAQKKEGIWKYYSASTEGYKISEESYSCDRREGISRKFYQTGDTAEVLPYHNGLKEGEWIQYYTDGKICLKAAYKNGMLEGAFMLYFPDGTPQYEGTYLNDKRNGRWKAYNEDGTVRSEIEYVNGNATDPSLAEQETKYLDELEKNKGKISDPEMTGNETK